jgi:prolyl-tRNA synthetase
MGHGDGAGMRVPPRLAHIQVVVMVIGDGGGVSDVADRIAKELIAEGVRARVDNRTDTPFGRRAVGWELKGVPVRIEVGARDLANGEVTVARRDSGAKANESVDAVAALVPGLLEEIQATLLAEATAFRDARTADVTTVDEAREAAQTGFARIPWATLGEQGETMLARDGVTVRCISRPEGSVPDAEDEPGNIAIVGRAY